MAIRVTGTEAGEPQSEEGALTARHIVQIAALGLTFVPFAFVLFGGTLRDVPLAVALDTGAAIVSSALYLSWATEMLEAVIPDWRRPRGPFSDRGPEYSFEVVLAWERKIGLAASSMTGSNRLLLGPPWPLIFFMAYFTGVAELVSAKSRSRARLQSTSLSCRRRLYTLC